MNKRILALLLALVMAVGALPTGAWAADTEVVSDANVATVTDEQWGAESHSATEQKAEQNAGGKTTQTQSQQAETGENGPETMASEETGKLYYNISTENCWDDPEPQASYLQTGERYYFNLWWTSDVTVVKTELFAKVYEIEPEESEFKSIYCSSDGYIDEMDEEKGDYYGWEFFSLARTLSYYWKVTYKSGNVQQLGTVTVTVDTGPHPIWGLEDYLDEDGYYKADRAYSTKARTIKLDLEADDGKLKYKSNNKKIKVSSSGKITIPKKYVGMAKITVTAPATYDYDKNVQEILVFAYPQAPKMKKVTSPKKGQIKITWKGVSDCQGYCAIYRLKGSSKWKRTYIKKKASSVVIKGLKSKKKYEVCIGTYKKNGTWTYYGWDKNKTIKVK